MCPLLKRLKQLSSLRGYALRFFAHLPLFYFLLFLFHRSVVSFFLLLYLWTVLSCDNCLADWATLLLLPLLYPPLLQASTVKHMQTVRHDTYSESCFEFLLADYTRVLPELNMRLHKRLFREQAKEFNDLLLQFFSTWRLRAPFLPNLRIVSLVPAASTAAFRAHNEAAE